MPDINGNPYDPKLEEQFLRERFDQEWDRHKKAEFDRFMEEYIETHWSELEAKFEEWLANEAERQWDARNESWYQ
jgi:hypothetical protein